MAKESHKARQRKRERMVIKYAEKRKRLKAEGRLDELDALPLNGSKVRLRNRCLLTGRPRGFIRDFGLSRNQFRDLALKGHIPGVRKASW
jgi:small subunit ribosomal protein S14